MIDWSSPLEDWEKPLEAPSKKPESLKDKVLRYGIKNPSAGVAKFGNKLLNIPSNLAELMGDKESADILSVFKDFDYDKALGLPEKKNLADISIQFLPELLGAFAIPEANLGKIGQTLGKIPKAGKYINKILSQGLPQAAYSGALAGPEEAGEAALTAGATMAPFSVASEFAKSTSPWARRAAQGIGAVGGFELGKIASEHAGVSPLAADVVGAITGALGARGMTSNRMMQQRFTEDMNPGLMAERLEASRRLGLDYLTPAEASLNPYLGARQGALGNTSEGSQMMYQKAKDRVASEEKAIHELLDMVYTGKEMKPKMEQLYTEAKKTTLPEEFINKYKDNEIIKHAQKDVFSSSAYREKLKNVPKDSVEYWDLVKQAISDLEEKAPKGERKIYTDARKDLVAEIDKIDPRYQEARAFAERKITRDKLEKAFDKTDPSGKSFFKVLASKDKFEKLQHNLRNVPEAQERLKDMKMIFGDLINPPTIRGAAALEKTSMNKPRSSSQAITNVLENALTKGKYDKEMIEFITNPNWDKLMTDLNKVSNKQERMAKFIEIFGKSMAQSAGHKEPFMTTEDYEFYD
jgi:hypothetical protein